MPGNQTAQTIRCEVTPEPTSWMEPAGTVAQIVTACVALFLAWRANRISKHTPYVERLLEELIRTRHGAREVKRLYARLFQPFNSLDEKIRARSEWLQAREAVGEDLDMLIEFGDEVMPTKTAWTKVEEVEDTHAIGDALHCSGSDHAIEQYAVACGRFNTAVAECIRKLLAQ